ncbi:hypothetical protein KI387_014521, partial [Taxus chinensis]
MSKPVQNGGFRGAKPHNRASKEEGKILSQAFRSEGDHEDEDDKKSSNTHQAMKNNKVFKGFFESLEPLSLKVINNEEWGCPACKGGGARANARYKGMQSLIEHAKTTKFWNGRLHQKFVKVLEEEVKTRGIACSVVQHVYGKWLGLENVYSEHEIVWPPMVVIQNTNFGPSNNQQKVMGMGTTELLECFKQYKPTKAKYASGPKGHCGVSLLVFDDSTLGYLEADYLHKHFLKDKRGRDDWDSFGMTNQHSSGKRILYGYMATSEDIDNFNKYSTKAKVKYDMVPYQSKVIQQVKKMEGDSQKVVWLETKIVEDQERTKHLEEKINQMAEHMHIQREDMNNFMRKAMECEENCRKG